MHVVSERDANKCNQEKWFREICHRGFEKPSGPHDFQNHFFRTSKSEGFKEKERM